ALRVLTVAREHLNGERVRCINGLTALVRSHALDIDARKALSSQQIDAIAGWRRRDEPFGIAVARAEAVRLAQRIRTLDDDLADNRTTITSVVAVEAPELLDLHGVGAITAAIVFTVWSHPGRIRTEAAFAQIAGTAPIPASSGNTVRHRLNRGGDRQLNRALNTIVLTRIRTDLLTRTYVERRLAEGKQDRQGDPSLPQTLRRSSDLPNTHPPFIRPRQSASSNVTQQRSIPGTFGLPLWW
ncbi:MAG TPA: transposase, partial [Propionibacteriaceae bacterium]|nr:transposase [Propionibacteriaceae bacterium]